MIITLETSGTATGVAEPYGDSYRTLQIPTTIYVDDKEIMISEMDFDICIKEKDALFKNGVREAKMFLKNWDYDKWRNEYESKNASKVV